MQHIGNSCGSSMIVFGLHNKKGKQPSKYKKIFCLVRASHCFLAVDQALFWVEQPVR